MHNSICLINNNNFFNLHSNVLMDTPCNLALYMKHFCHKNTNKSYCQWFALEKRHIANFTPKAWTMLYLLKALHSRKASILRYNNSNRFWNLEWWNESAGNYYIMLNKMHPFLNSIFKPLGKKKYQSFELQWDSGADMSEIEFNTGAS